jgi:hypothetical protein
MQALYTITQYSETGASLIKWASQQPIALKSSKTLAANENGNCDISTANVLITMP